MEIDYTITLDYSDATLDDEPCPTEDDIVDWIVGGMARAGFTAARVKQAVD